jgi:type I restriction enzyme S subunit
MAERSEAVKQDAVRDGSAVYSAEPEVAATEDVLPGYKRTEVGVIPENWSTETIFAVAEYSKSRFDDGDWVEAEFLTTSGVRLLQTGNIGVGVFKEKESKKYISTQSFQQLRCKDVFPGDLLICRLADPAGRACIAPDLGSKRMITSVDVTIFRPSPELADPNFLLGVFCTPRWFSEVADRCGGSTRTRISRSQLAKIPIQLPSVEEQRAIATALSDADALIESLNRLIAKKRAIKQAAMQQLLTGRTRLPGFTGEWETKRLGDYVRFLKTGTNSRSELSSNGSLAYLHYGDIHVGASVTLNPNATSVPHIAALKVRHLDKLAPGDLVFVDASEDLEGIGKSVEIAEVPKEGMVAGLHTIAARFDKNVLADGFKAYLQFCPEFIGCLRRLAAGTKVLATNRQHIAGVEIALPGVPEQQAIATVLSDMDTEIEALERRRDKARRIKQGMMQQLLTGRVRLV